MTTKNEHPKHMYPTIHLSNNHREVIYKEFPVTRQTVNNALKYHSNSRTAQAIRKRAAELLKIEVKKVNELIKREQA